MTAKEKSAELFATYLKTIGSNCEHDSYCDRKECQFNGNTFCCVSQEKAKKCALIAVEEILSCYFNNTLYTNFWSNVKKELEKM